MSLTRDVGGVRTLVEARPATVGGVVLAQSISDASFAGAAVKRIALSLLIGLAVAALAGVLLARLLARPLRQAATTARLLAAGARDVRVPPEGPAEVAEVADSLNALSAALATSEGRQREFLLSVSHELRTPLTAITGFAESLADGVTTGPDVQPVARTVLGEAHRLERLVSDLLDLARLGAQDFRIDLRPVDLTALMETAGEVWRARCEAVGVVGRTDLPRTRLLCVTDPTRVRQIVDGLAENALRVTPAGRPVLLGLYETQGFAGHPGPRRRPGPVPGGPAGRVRAVGALPALPGRPPGRHRRRARPGARADDEARRQRGRRPGARGRRLLHRPAAAAAGPERDHGPAAAPGPARGRVGCRPRLSVGCLGRQPRKGPA
jgi:HAMP domain-containing protein